MSRNFQDTQKEILNSNRINIPRHAQGGLIPIRPAAKAQERRFDLLDLLYQRAAPLDTLLTSGPQTFW
jgi:hypothetical protein